MEGNRHHLHDNNVEGSDTNNDINSNTTSCNNDDADKKNNKLYL